MPDHRLVGPGLPSPAELERIAVGVAVDVAADASRAIRAAPEPSRAVSTKSTQTDIVTALDLEVEQAIRTALAVRTPGSTIVGEEQGSTTGRSPVGWVVDPIDGTVNLAYDVPFFGVSLAATVAEEVVAGCVVDVMSGEVFSAAAGGGARRAGTPIGPAAVDDLAMSLVATGFSYSPAGRAKEAQTLARVLPAARDIRCFGSTALHLCWVACGRIDAFYQRGSKVWDHAAGALIAAESGARVEMPSVGNDSLVLAAAPGIFDALRPLLDEGGVRMPTAPPLVP